MINSDKNTVAIPDQDRFLAVLDGKRCRTSDMFYAQINAALMLPDYFGGNLDALYDCLCDLSWLKEKHVTLLVTRSELLLSQDSSEKKTALLETLSQAEQEQYEADRSFQLILLSYDQV
jgi:RNAse (barnase) inhibitor barstar